METFGIFQDFLVALWPFVLFYSHFGTFCGYLVYIFTVLVCCTEKNLATPVPSAAALDVTDT
jgi:hypothetical protein